ncbi:MAG: efflux RND transporter permease subunit, partial [Terriglobia bacterium]
VVIFFLSLLLYPLLGFSFFPRTDAGQFMMNLKAPTGTRLDLTEDYVKKVENIIRHKVSARDLSTVVSNIGLSSGFESLFTPNAAMHTAFVEVGLHENHRVSSFKYMDEVRQEVAAQLPELRTYFHSGSLVESVLDQGVPASMDIQVSGMDLNADMATAQELASKIRRLPSISDVYIPQDMNYPALLLDVNRTRASELGLTPKGVIDNVITALTSNQMIAPGYWIDPKSGNQYFVSVQYPDRTVTSLEQLDTMPLHAPNLKQPTYLDQLCTIRRINAPTEVDHYQLERDIDIYVKPQGEDLSRPYQAIQKIIASTPLLSRNFRVNIRGLVVTMESSFRSFAVGLILAVLLVYLILVWQFRSFVDPFLILLAVPPGVAGVLVILFLTGTTVNIQSLMGVLMMTGIVVSNTILIVDLAKRLQFEKEKPVREAVALACRIRLRPILMTSLATIVGLLPMAFRLEAGSAAYAPLAIAIIGGVSVSVILSIFVIPAAYLLAYSRPEKAKESEGAHPA